MDSKKDDGVIMMGAWCPEDMVEVLQAHAQKHPHQTWASRLVLFINDYTTLWSQPGESLFTQLAWNDLLKVLLDYWGKGERLEIHIPPSAPLRCLMTCLSRLQLESITVLYGTASLEEMESWVDRWPAIQATEPANMNTTFPTQKEKAHPMDTNDRLEKVEDAMHISQPAETEGSTAHLRLFYTNLLLPSGVSEASVEARKTGLAQASGPITVHSWKSRRK